MATCDCKKWCLESLRNGPIPDGKGGWVTCKMDRGLVGERYHEPHPCLAAVMIQAGIPRPRVADDFEEIRKGMQRLKNEREFNKPVDFDEAYTLDPGFFARVAYYRQKYLVIGGSGWQGDDGQIIKTLLNCRQPCTHNGNGICCKNISYECLRERKCML